MTLPEAVTAAPDGTEEKPPRHPALPLTANGRGGAGPGKPRPPATARPRIGQERAGMRRAPPPDDDTAPDRSARGWGRGAADSSSGCALVSRFCTRHRRVLPPPWRTWPSPATAPTPSSATSAPKSWRAPRPGTWSRKTCSAPPGCVKGRGAAPGGTDALGPARGTAGLGGAGLGRARRGSRVRSEGSRGSPRRSGSAVVTPAAHGLSFPVRCDLDKNSHGV